VLAVPESNGTARATAVMSWTEKYQTLDTLRLPRCAVPPIWNLSK
jgi:hypothetical protein